MTVLALPRDLACVCGMDWGHAEPGCLLWALLFPGEGVQAGKERIHVIKEWKFTRLSDDEIAHGYKTRTRELGVKPQYVAGDPSMWIRDGRNATKGQSRAETFLRAGMPMKRAENARVDGWSRLHSLLRVPCDDEGRVLGDPLLTIDESCAYLRRTIPSQQSSRMDPDDVDTHGDDHGPDALRYLAMSRPMPFGKRKATVVYPPMSLGAIVRASQPVPGILAGR